MTPRPRPAFSLTGLLLLLLGASGAAAIWVLLTFSTGWWSSLPAFIATVDLAWLLRLARLRGGIGRAVLGAAGTLLAIVLAQWWLHATQVGLAMGMLPWESIPKMGAGFAWTLTRLALQPMDLLVYAAAIGLAAILSR